MRTNGSLPFPGLCIESNEQWRRNHHRQQRRLTWQRKPAKNEVARADFEKALAGKDANAVIIDVRASHELKAGKLSNALSVPLDELDNKLGLLPKDKKIYAICPTGTRGAIVAGELRKKGFDAYFLSADVECKGEKCIFSNF